LFNTLFTSSWLIYGAWSQDFRLSTKPEEVLRGSYCHILKPPVQLLNNRTPSPCRAGCGMVWCLLFADCDFS